MRVGDACPKGLPSGASIATNASAPIRFGVFSPGTACTSGTAKSQVGIHAGTARDREGSARHEDTASTRVPSNTAMPASPTLPARSGTPTSPSCSTSTTPCNVVRKRTSSSHHDRSADGVEPTTVTTLPSPTGSAIAAHPTHHGCVQPSLADYTRSTYCPVTLNMSVIENEFGALVENPTSQRIGPSGCRHAAIAHGSTTCDRHVLEHDDRVRPGDVKHAIHYSLPNRHSRPLACEDVCLDPGPEVVNIEIARDPSPLVDVIVICNRQRISCACDQVNDFRCVDSAVLVGGNNIRSQTVGHTIRHRRVGVEHRGNDSLVQFFHRELCRKLFLADRPEALPANSLP
jgi:hypothetical protein